MKFELNRKGARTLSIAMAIQIHEPFAYLASSRLRG